MSLSYGFYNSIAHDRQYDALQFGMIFDGIIKDGVYATYKKAFVVKASDNAGYVVVQPGRAWFDHTWTYNDADLPVPVEASETVLDRIDALVIDINSELSERQNTLQWVKGTPSNATPEKPTNFANTDTHHQYPIAYVFRHFDSNIVVQDDIENAVGTSLCPFVTGIIDTVNIDELLLQWDAEFHTWEENQKQQFEAWAFNRQEVFTAWFNTVKDELAADLTEFNEWFESIKGILDEDAAIHLQAEIDELKLELPLGSRILISTEETELYLRDVTVSDGDGHSETVEFDNTGHAEVASFGYVGENLIVYSTTGERTARSNLYAPYFGRYVVSIAFFEAPVNIIGDELMGGLTVTIKNSEGGIVTTVPLDESGMGEFIATYPDTYTFTVTSGGEIMEVSLTVTEETTYSVELRQGPPEGSTATPINDIAMWLETAWIEDKEYTTLTEILEDKDTLWDLVSDSNSVDYLVRCTDWIEAITTNPAALNIIALSDYCCDKLCKNLAWSTAICDSAYYSIILRDRVPTMVGVNNPEGSVIFGGNTVNTNSNIDSFFPFYPYYANRNTGSLWRGKAYSTGGGDYLGYMFVKPTMVKMVTIKHESAVTSQTLKIQASTNGENWVDLTNEITITPVADVYAKIPLIENYDYYKFYRVYVISQLPANNYYGRIRGLQFYGVVDTREFSTIHSAAYDTIYYLDDGEPIVVCSTDENGIGEITWSDLPLGKIELISSVAKNTNNGELEYSKVIRNTHHKCVDYLMPLGYLYWYGAKCKRYSDNVPHLSGSNGMTFADNNQSGGTYSGSLSYGTNEMTTIVSDSTNGYGYIYAFKFLEIEVTEYENLNAFVEYVYATQSYDDLRLNLVPDTPQLYGTNRDNNGNTNPPSTVFGVFNILNTLTAQNHKGKITLDVASDYGFRIPAFGSRTNNTNTCKWYALWFD